MKKPNQLHRKRNEYAELARESLRALAVIAEAIGRDENSELYNPKQEAVFAVSELWHRLVWSDRQLNAHECHVLDVLIEESKLLGLEKPDISLIDTTYGGSTPQLMVRALEFDATHGTRFASSVVNHLESCGYAILASDRNISTPELLSLQEYLRELRLARGSFTKSTPKLETRAQKVDIMLR